jgi:hypothetical protein
MMVARLRFTEEERQQIFFGGEDLFISEILYPDHEGKSRFTPLDVMVGMQHLKVNPPIEESQGDGSKTD